jgi:hypothetical protein
LAKIKDLYEENRERWRKEREIRGEWGRDE